MTFLHLITLLCCAMLPFSHVVYFCSKRIIYTLLCNIDKLEEYGITSFGVSVTTLEEVFMKVGEGAEKTLHDM